jgi:hypothetical protein
MKAASFKSVRDGILRKMGLDSSLPPLASQAAALADYVQGALDMAWPHYPWPDVTLVEERTPTGSPAHEIDFDQPNETPIGDFLQIFDNDPEDYAQSSNSLRFSATTTGVTLDSDDHTPGTPVFVRFRIPLPLFSSREYSASTAYLPGDVVYHDPTGDCYLALASTTGNDPTDPAFWRRQLIPTYLAEFCKAHAYASTLLEDGQFDKANYMLARAEGILAEKQDDFWMKRDRYHHYTARFTY